MNTNWRNSPRRGFEEKGTYKSRNVKKKRRKLKSIETYFIVCFSDGSDLLDDAGDDAKSVRTNDDSKK